MNADIKKNWANCFVPELVLKAIEKEGFSQPTEIQKLVLPFAIRDRRDILGAAATGTGKTLAFGIPMISRILMDRQKEIENYLSQNNDNPISDDDEENDDENDSDEACDLSPSESELEFNWQDEEVKPNCLIGVEMTKFRDNCKPYEHIYGLVLTPTRELACQVAKHLKNACQFTDLKVCAIFGGMSVEKQERLLNKKPEILIVTPGRFWSFIQDQESHALSASKISVLVIDEADRMLEKGHFAELQNLIKWLETNSGDRITKGVPMKQRQTFVFSATLTFVHSVFKSVKSLKKANHKMTKNDKIKNFIVKLGMNEQPKIIDTTVEVAQLNHWRIHCPSQQDKDSRLFWFLKHHPGRTIVFVNSKNSVRRLASVLQTLGLSPKSLMGDIQQNMRLKKLDSFSKTANSLMIASDVAARGLDIPKIDYVIHFDVANVAETHLHRSGRTARAANSGHSVIMLCPGEAVKFNRLMTSLKKSESDIKDINPESIEVYEDIVSLAREIESASHINESRNKSKKWFERMADEAEIELDDCIPDLNKEKPSKQVNVELNRKTQALKSMLIKLNKSDSKFVSPITVATDCVSVPVVSNECQSEPMNENQKSKKKRNKNKRKLSDEHHNEEISEENKPKKVKQK